jgi:membrane-bound lytic murein transglycosylase D
MKAEGHSMWRIGCRDDEARIREGASRRTALSFGRSLVIAVLACLTAAACPWFSAPVQAARAVQPGAGTVVPVFDVPSSLTFCGEKIPLERQDVWELMDRAMITAVYSHPQVILWIKRANRYFPYVEKKLKERGMPDDLKYIVIAESALNPYAVSSAKASGPWQFVADTAKRYGLRVDKWIDERQNFERATDAALSYLTDLYNMYKSWSLAVAAYNCGENKVVRNLNNQGVQTYFDLDLPLETEFYLFRILAIKTILSRPESYGYRITPERRYPPFDYDSVAFSTNKEIPITAIAQACGATYKAIKEMNPELKQDVVPPGKYRLNIPKGKSDAFKAVFTDGT